MGVIFFLKAKGQFLYRSFGCHKYIHLFVQYFVVTEFFAFFCAFFLLFNTLLYRALLSVYKSENKWTTTHYDLVVVTAGVSALTSAQVLLIGRESRWAADGPGGLRESRVGGRHRRDGRLVGSDREDGFWSGGLLRDVDDGALGKAQVSTVVVDAPHASFTGIVQELTLIDVWGQKAGELKEKKNVGASCCLTNESCTWCEHHRRPHLCTALWLGHTRIPRYTVKKHTVMKWLTFVCPTENESNSLPRTQNQKSSVFFKYDSFC